MINPRNIKDITDMIYQRHKPNTLESETVK